MSPSSHNVPLPTIQRQCRCDRHRHRSPIIHTHYTHDITKKTSLDTTTYTYFSDEATNDRISCNENFGNRKALISIIITTSSHGNNDDDCSNDTASTIGVVSPLNDNQRSLFSNYWDENGPKTTNIPATVLSRSPSHYTSETSASVASSAIKSNASDAISLVHRTKTEMRLSTESYKSYQEYCPPEIPKRNTSKSDIDEYEIALRGYEHGRTTIPRTAVLNDQHDTTIKTSVMDDRPTKSENDDSLPNQTQHNPLHPSPRTVTRRNIFSNYYSNSEVNLPSYRYSSDYILRLSSTSALLPTRRTWMKHHRSCLRPLGRSLSASAGSGTTGGDSSVADRVTFNPNVRVLEYDRPHIVQASDGWSKYFV